MQVVQRIPNILPSGNVLDIGGGVGRNTLFLARHGFSIDVIDLSEVGLEKIATEAAQENLPVTTTLGDITELGITKTYSVIIAAYILHHIQNKAARDLIENIRSHTEPGGLNIIGTFTKDGDFYRNDIADERFFPDTNELKGLYKDWKIISYTESSSTALRKHEDGTPMINTAAVLLAQKMG